jgi:hypothetical protein
MNVLESHQYSRHQVLMDVELYWLLPWFCQVPGLVRCGAFLLHNMNFGLLLAILAWHSSGPRLWVCLEYLYDHNSMWNWRGLKHWNSKFEFQILPIVHCEKIDHHLKPSHFSGEFNLHVCGPSESFHNRHDLGKSTSAWKISAKKIKLLVTRLAIWILWSNTTKHEVHSDRG